MQYFLLKSVVKNNHYVPLLNSFNIFALLKYSLGKHFAENRIHIIELFIYFIRP